MDRIDSSQTWDRDGTLIASQTITTTYDWAASPPTVTITVTDDATGQVVSTTTQAVPLPEREQHAFESELLTEFTAFKAALDTLTATLPNNAFTGAREVKEFARATRRMFRAAIRDVKQVDTGV